MCSVVEGLQKFLIAVIRGVRVEHFFGSGRVISIFFQSSTRKCSGTRIFFSGSLISSGTRMPSATITSPGTGTSLDI